MADKEQLQEQKKQTSAQEETTGVLKEVNKKLAASNKNEAEANKIQKKSFAESLKTKFRETRKSLVAAPGKALSGAGNFLKEGASNTFKSLGGIFKTIIGPAGIFGLMLVFFKALQNPRFRDAVSSLITFVKGVFTNTFDFLSDAFNAIVDLVGGVTDKLGTIFGGDATFKERTDALVGIFGDLGKFIFNIGNSLITNVLEMFGVSFEPYDSAGAYLLGKLKEMWNSITSFFGDAKDFVVDGYNNIADWVSNAVTQGWANIKAWFTGAAEFVVDGATNVKDWVKSKVTGAWSNIKEWFSGKAEFVVEGATNIKDWIEGSVSNGWMNVKNWFAGKADMAKQDFKDFSAFVGDKMRNSMAFAEDLFAFSEEDMTAKGVTSKLIDFAGIGINAGTNFAKDIFGFGNPDEPFKLSEFLIGETGVLTRLGDGIVGLGKKIYDPETGQIFGTDMPEIPSLSDMYDGIKGLAKKIYDPDTGAIFGFVPGEIFDFQLPNFSDMFMNLAGSMLPKPDSFLGRMLYKLPGTDTLKQAASMFGQGGKMVDGQFTMPSETGTTTEPEVVQMSLDEVNARIAELESMAEDADMANDFESERVILNRIDELSAAYDNAIMEGAKQVPVTVVQGGNNTSVSQSSSTFSLQKSTASPDTTFNKLSYAD